MSELSTAVARQAPNSKDADLALGSLLGRFGHRLTSVVDTHLGSDWAENDEILALLALRHDMAPTTRELADASGLHRRALSRLVARLRDDGMAETRASTVDRRSVVVELTPKGRRCYVALEHDVDQLFQSEHQTAADICVHLACGPSTAPCPAVRCQDALSLLELLIRAGDQLVRSLDESAGPSALAGSQRTALVLIASEPGLRPVDLVPSLGFGRSGVAYVVDQLCDKGLVTRERHTRPDDARAVVLTVTPAGRAAARSVADAALMHRLRLGPLFAAVRDWS